MLNIVNPIQRIESILGASTLGVPTSTLNPIQRIESLVLEGGLSSFSMKSGIQYKELKETPLTLIAFAPINVNPIQRIESYHLYLVLMCSL